MKMVATDKWIMHLNSINAGKEYINAVKHAVFTVTINSDGFYYGNSNSPHLNIKITGINDGLFTISREFLRSMKLKRRKL